MIEIDALPWPAAVLSPNATGHWSPKARAFQKHKAWAHTACLNVRRHGLPEGVLSVVIHAYPPVRRKRDRDNFAGRCKAYLDGIAWSFGIDDERFDPRVEWHEPEKPGKVIITLSPLMARIAA